MNSRKSLSRRRAVAQDDNFEQVGYLCRRIMQASLRDLQETTPELDVTIGQMGTLVLIACNPGITPGEICRAQGHEKPTITASLDALERRKLIRRKTSKVDRRSFGLFLTPRGVKFYQEITPRVKQSDRRLTQCLSEEERETLTSLLMRIYNSECIEKEAITGAPGVRLKIVAPAPDGVSIVKPIASGARNDAKVEVLPAKMPDTSAPRPRRAVGRMLAK